MQRTLRWFGHGGVEAVHVVSSVAVVTEQELVLEEHIRCQL